MGTGGAGGLARRLLLFLSSQASPCGQLVWASSQHGSLGIVGQLPWQQMSSRSSVPANKGHKLSYDLAFDILFATGQQSCKFEGRENKPHFSIRRVSESFCRKSTLMRDTVEAVFGKSHLPYGPTVNS